MSETKFTKGPWESRVFLRGVGFGIHAPGKEHSLASANLYEHTSYVREFGDAETHANAHLISAAPEMYEALDAIIDSATDGRNVPEWLSELIVDARAALAKARGEQ